MPVPLFWQSSYQEGLLECRVLAVSIAIVAAILEQLAAISARRHTSFSSTMPAAITNITANINSEGAFVASNCNIPYTGRD